MRAHPDIALRGDRNECPGCGKLFSSSFAFGKHRAGDYGINRRCLSEAEMLHKGMRKNGKGFWISAARGEATFGEAA